MLYNVDCCTLSTFRCTSELEEVRTLPLFFSKNLENLLGKFLQAVEVINFRLSHHLGSIRVP